MNIRHRRILVRAATLASLMDLTLRPALPDDPDGQGSEHELEPLVTKSVTLKPHYNMHRNPIETRLEPLCYSEISSQKSEQDTPHKTSTTPTGSKTPPLVSAKVSLWSRVEKG